MNGVNLGGWLVIEEFLAPDMYMNTTTQKPYRSPRIPGGVNFQDYGPYGERQLGWAADELDKNDTTHTKNYTGRFRAAMFNHRNTFIQESDFALMAANGINCVRIPVGFWLFQQTQAELFPFVEGSYLNLNDAFDWAETHGIGIWLDFHAQNGSQNGYEASAPTRARAGFWDLAPGQTTNIFGPGGPAKNDLSYVQDSINFATQLIQTYCPRSALVAMSMLNEPNSQNVTVLQNYHYALYPIYRQYCPDQWFVVAPQIFYEIPGTFWQQFMANSSYTKVLQDIHDYPKSPKTNTVDGWTAQAFNSVYQTWNNYIKGGGIKAVFGEWTLSGPNYNYSGYDGTWDNTPIQINVSNYYDASKHAFMQPGTQGFFQWNYRIWQDQGPDVWSWYRCIYNNWLGKAHLYSYPQNVTCQGC